MATLATLQRRTATLEQETRRLYPTPGRRVTEDWLTLFNGDELDQVTRFLESIEPHVSYRDNGTPDLTGLTDDELDTLLIWANLAKEREEASKKR